MTELGKKLLATLGTQAPTVEPDTLQEFDADLIPDIEIVESTDPDLDNFMDSIDILDAYAKWCGKMEPNPKGKRESIMISCPKPEHPDGNPSAWVNLDKQTWFCGGCQEGGDKYDIAAMHFGYARPDYKDKDQFPHLVADMAASLGYVVKHTITGQAYVSEVGLPEEDPEIPNNVVGITPMQEAPTITPPPGAGDDFLYIDWEELLPETGFLRSWMEAATIDDLPHEYYFWLGLQAIGAAIGTNVVLNDYVPVKGNLFCVLYGKTASGKSRAMHPWTRMLREALPYAEDPFEAPTGTLVAPTPGSAEALLDIFSHSIVDPSTMEIIDHGQVNGIVKIDELASFSSRASRSGSTFKETLIELFDVYEGDVTLKTIGGGVRTAHNPYCQFVSTTQPRAISDFLSKTDEHSGFLNRWILAAGRPRVEPRSYGAYRHDLHRPIEELKNVKRWADAGFEYVLDGAALDVWDEHFRTKIVPLQDADDPILGRIDLIEKKLMILLSADQHHPYIAADTVRRVITLHKYLVDVMLLFSSGIRSTEQSETWNHLVDIFKKYKDAGKKPPTRREINTACKSIEPAQVTKILKDMVEAGVVDTEVSKGKTGPATERYVLVGMA